MNIAHESRLSTRSSSGFDFKHHCFYCGKQITEREKQQKKVHWVSCKNLAEKKRRMGITG